MVIYTFKKCTLTEKMSLSDMACQSHKNNIKSENKAIVRPCHCLDLYAKTANFCLQNIIILSCRAYKHYDLPIVFYTFGHYLPEILLKIYSMTGHVTEVKTM